MPQKEERMFSMLIYLLSFFTAIIGPLIIWLLKKDESELIDHHGKEYINFFISYAIYGLVASISMIILIGFILAPAVGIAYFVFTIIAAIKAYEGSFYQIPLIIRFLK
ncbi:MULTISPECIES: DUF4870 domain-containing protein [Bacillaceae]|uniref:DUF4870 domain-containing protein n=1 Tax=Bacillaceae TaxID=186817 RepID=UPI0004794D16|nr:MULTISPECIES: DUF4870 domain-containing protein [Bacillaceae]UOE92517.1 DUF4870 domain-containing protein [Alkalihalobacillus sp. LMS39]